MIISRRQQIKDDWDSFQSCYYCNHWTGELSGKPESERRYCVLDAFPPEIILLTELITESQSVAEDLSFSEKQLDEHIRRNKINFKNSCNLFQKVQFDQVLIEDLAVAAANKIQEKEWMFEFQIADFFKEESQQDFSNLAIQGEFLRRCREKLLERTSICDRYIDGVNCYLFEAAQRMIAEKLKKVSEEIGDSFRWSFDDTTNRYIFRFDFREVENNDSEEYLEVNEAFERHDLEPHDTYLEHDCYSGDVRSKRTKVDLEEIDAIQ